MASLMGKSAWWSVPLAVILGVPMYSNAAGIVPVVQALLANTSTQMFFSPDPEDADLIRATLNSSLRYGAMTLDLPSLQCWLRARVGGRWQPPTLTQIRPLPRADGQRVRGLIEEVIASHPAEYLPANGWQERASRVLEQRLPSALARLLDEFLAARIDHQTAKVPQPVPAGDERRLGF